MQVCLSLYEKRECDHALLLSIDNIIAFTYQKFQLAAATTMTPQANHENIV